MLKNQGFNELSEDALSFILQSDRLRMDEEDILSKVTEWATVNSVSEEEEGGREGGGREEGGSEEEEGGREEGGRREGGREEGGGRREGGRESIITARIESIQYIHFRS